MKTEEMVFSGFTRVDVRGAVEVELVRSGSYNVTADDGLSKYLKVAKEGETLKVGRSIRSYLRPRISKPKARISMPELHGLRLSGASEGRVAGFSSTHDFSLDLSGASSLDIARISTGDAKVKLSGASRVTGGIETANSKFDLSGASRVELKGLARDIIVNASGASHAELEGFSVNDANFKLSGASHGIIKLSGRLDARLSGASHLKYIGEPTLGDINTSGASTLSKK